MANVAASYHQLRWISETWVERRRPLDNSLPLGLRQRTSRWLQMADQDELRVRAMMHIIHVNMQYPSPKTIWIWTTPERCDLLRKDTGEHSTFDGFLHMQVQSSKQAGGRVCMVVEHCTRNRGFTFQTTNDYIFDFPDGECAIYEKLEPSQINNKWCLGKVPDVSRLGLPNECVCPFTV